MLHIPRYLRSNKGRCTEKQLLRKGCLVLLAIFWTMNQSKFWLCEFVNYINRQEISVSLSLAQKDLQVKGTTF